MEISKASEGKISTGQLHRDVRKVALSPGNRLKNKMMLMQIGGGR
jgi:hypothetical protein